jgi:hypothetical protein
MVFGSLVACGDDDMPTDAGTDTRPMDTGTDVGPVDSGVRDWPGATSPNTHVVAPGVRRDDVDLPGAVPPANPSTGEATPEQYNRITVLRYRQDVEPAAQARAVVIGMSSLLGGAVAMENLAVGLVSRSVEISEPIEVWYVERRSNLMEDLRGMEAAEVAENPDIASGYYQSGETVDGEAFPGFREPEDVSFMTEWGLGMHVDELRMLVERLPEAERQGRVFLLGHAEGADVMDGYAAWRFEDGVRGAEQVAGLIMVDGEMLGETEPLTEEEYLRTDGIPVAGLVTIYGLENQRTEPSQRMVGIPLLGLDLFTLAETLAMRAHFEPEAVVDDIVRDTVFGLLLDLEVEQVPPTTNAAGYGLVFDVEYAAFTAISANLGTVVGPTEAYHNFLLGDELQHPSDPTHTYTWLDGDVSDPEEPSTVALEVAAGMRGRHNFFDWYHPMRLSLDVMASRGGAVAADGYQVTHGIRAIDGPMNGAPVLAIATARATRAGYESYRGRLAATIGSGRSNAGAVRATDDAAFRILELPNMTHADPIAGRDDEAVNPIPREVHAFILSNASTGTIDVTLE